MEPVKGRAGSQTEVYVNPKPWRDFWAAGLEISFAQWGRQLFFPLEGHFHFSKVVPEDSRSSRLSLLSELGVWGLRHLWVVQRVLLAVVHQAWTQPQSFGAAHTCQHGVGYRTGLRQMSTHLFCYAFKHTVICNHGTICSLLFSNHNNLRDAIKTSRFHFITNVISRNVLKRLFHASVW